MTDTLRPPLILASASVSRANVLAGAGLSFRSEPSHCDEDAIKDRMKTARAPTADVAESLAREKTAIISARYPKSYVIGADQMLECAGAWLDKPKDMEEARSHLQILRGQTHHLVSATVIMVDRQCVWRHADQAHLTMRSFSDEFIDTYLAFVGEEVCRSVGAYQLEGMGAQLFSKIEGDYFSILGLPLLPLLNFLREQGILSE
ncbi:MAG: Maf family protein [Alphaproteobacteria bacterium]|jgi:septum formation protein